MKPEQTARTTRSAVTMPLNRQPFTRMAWSDQALATQAQAPQSLVCSAFLQAGESGGVFQLLPQLPGKRLQLHGQGTGPSVDLCSK